MSRRTETIPPAYFDDLYAADEDPWRFRTSGYEKKKYAETLSMLEGARYGRGLEVGCSIGVFTRMLAGRCDWLLGIDGSSKALATAGKECVDLGNVVFEKRVVPAAFPSGSFDLIVLSEVLYYLVADDVARTAMLCDGALEHAGEIVLCHWVGETDYPLTGDAAADLFLDSVPRARWAHTTVRHDQYRLDHLARRRP